MKGVFEKCSNRFCTFMFDGFNIKVVAHEPKQWYVTYHCSPMWWFKNEWVEVFSANQKINANQFSIIKQRILDVVPDYNMSDWYV